MLASDGGGRHTGCGRRVGPGLKIGLRESSEGIIPAKIPQETPPGTGSSGLGSEGEEGESGVWSESGVLWS